MKKITNIFILTLIGLLIASTASADKVKDMYKNGGSKKSSVNARTAAGCLPGKTSNELNLNNVRARINTGGDMWWDLQNTARYEIPKGSKKTSMFSASLWLGGTDVNGQLKGAFQRYRNNGDDFWPGPLTTDGTAAIGSEVCQEYDKHFVVTREQVDEFILKQNNPDYPDYSVPDIIKDWPAHGDVSKGQSSWLAPFADLNNNGYYDWNQGEYPYYDRDNKLCKPSRAADGEYYYEKTPEGGILADAVLKGDQTIWWVFNDNGNIHSESRGKAIGVEIRAQAFAFSTNDEINNMTFYTYEIINRSTYRLTDTYFSQWVDTDLGDARDDYVGCDVARGLGYCYNGKDVDGTGKPQDYGVQPPAVGVDFFQGPYMDPDNKDNQKFTYDTINGTPVQVQICDESINGVNFGDSIVDNERFGMRRFVYHNNPPGGVAATQDPSLAPQYYNLLKGIWKDGSKMTYGGDAYQEPSNLECDFMFPGLTDPCNWGTNGIDPGAIKDWTEKKMNNPAGDRRFMQSAGEFTLESGAINYITVGIPWARAASGGAWASVLLLQEVDDKAQALFDNCFKVLDGPDAPELIAQELNKTIVLYLKNIEASNNAKEDYSEEDVTISAIKDSLGNQVYSDVEYRFQGYQIFQLANKDVSVSEIRDPDKSRLVAQCDLKDDVENLVNYTKNDKLGGNVPELMVEANNEGVVHSFEITEDEFAVGDRRLVNNKKYYYVAIAYAFNEYAVYSQDPGSIDGLKGQKKPYLAGRKSALGPIKVHTLMPHMPNAEANGTKANSSYGDGPMITRLDGRGNGGVELELTTASHNSIMNDNQKVKIQYTNNHGPINVKVIDPLKVQAALYELKFVNEASNIKMDTARWILFKNGTQIATSDTTIEFGNEQLFLDEGFSIQIIQNKGAGDPNNNSNGFISAEIVYADSSHKWLAGWPDIDGRADINSTTPSAFNWIRAGSVEDKSKSFHDDYDPAKWIDENETYEKLLGGRIAPYRLASKYDNGPARLPHLAKIENCESVDIVFTSDKTKWTRCVVLEACDNAASSEGNVNKLEPRAHASIDKDGNYATGSGSSTNPDDPNYIDAEGMGWFPGYAISLESGERLNIAFAESSWLVGENGRDMKFNPTSNFTTSVGDPLMGGKHFVYIFRNAGGSGSPAYDAGKWLRGKLNSAIGVNVMQKDIMWVTIPMANPAEKWYSNTATVKLRVDYPYMKNSWNGATNPSNGGYPSYEFNTGNIAAELGHSETAENALDLIRVVPNPYYAFSAYETDQIDNRVRITNLPERCTIKIFATNGTLVRTYHKDESNTWIDWNLKNHANIPIASGVYYIHIDAPGIGETVVKWFGVLRPVDLNAF